MRARATFSRRSLATLIAVFSLAGGAFNTICRRVVSRVLQPGRRRPRAHELDAVDGFSELARRTGNRTGRWVSLILLAHEYFHLFNAKRLRPVGLGPFDFEQSPTTGSLWIAEGVTSYYSDLLLTRSDLRTPEQHLASLSNLMDYMDVLEWYGLRFTASTGRAGAWQIERRPEATDIQKRNLAAWLRNGRAER